MTTVAATTRLSVAAACAMVTLLAPIRFPRAGGPVWFDRPITTWCHRRWHSVDRLLLLPSEIYLWLPLICCGAVYFAIHDRTAKRALPLLTGPIFAVVSTELILKPLIGRRLDSPYVHGSFYDYPSGSTVALASTVVAWVVVVRRTTAKVAIALVGLACLVGVAIALIRYDYHYPTDIVAAVCWSIAVVFTVDAIGHFARIK